MTDDNKRTFDSDALARLQEAGVAYQAALDAIKDEQEAYWDSLSDQQQLDAFCAVVRRIYHGEMVERRSYRGVLYEVFGFGPEAYVQAQEAGYLDLHNLQYNTVDECVRVVQNAVEHRIPASEYADLIRKHFWDKRNDTGNTGDTDN